VLSGEHGAATVVALGCIAVLASLALWIGAAAIVMDGRARATVAADAAALAAAPVTFLPFGAVGSPADEAARFARANDAVLVSCTCPIDRSFDERSVEVHVERRVVVPVFGTVGIHAVGRAEFLPARLLEARGSDADGR
jgi:hypothetical protein